MEVREVHEAVDAALTAIADWKTEVMANAMDSVCEGDVLSDRVKFLEVQFRAAGVALEHLMAAIARIEAN